MIGIVYETYTRKSEEPDDRQILSLPSQLKECADKFPDLHSVREIQECRSAKQPGRPDFNALLDRVEAGLTQGIIAWHPDRLSRNSVDAGRIIYLLDTGKLKDLKFVSYTFENTPEGKWMLAMIMGQAKYQVDKLSVDVRRGNREKYERGGITWRAMQGYRNNLGEKTIEVDLERFDLVRQMWSLFLTGSYSVPHIRRIATDEWGYRTRVHGKKCGGRPIALSALYLMFRNPLYAGVNVRPDGTTYPTSHQPMITLEEFWRAQKLLGRKGRPKPRGRPATYAGSWIRCGECGCSVTPDHRAKKLKNGTVLHFDYYRCTKKRGACRQRFLRRESLEDQAAVLIDQVALPKACLTWTMKYLKHRADRETSVETEVTSTKQRTSQDIEKELRNLAVMRRKDQLEESEYLEQRGELLAERTRFTNDGISSEGPKWLTPALQLLDFSSACLFWFWKGEPLERRTIVQAVAGSHLTLLDLKVNFKPVGPFVILANRAQYATWSGFAEDIRTYFIEHGEDAYLPVLKPVPSGSSDGSINVSERQNPDKLNRIR